MARSSLWKNPSDLAQSLAVTTDELLAFRKHRNEHIREKDRIVNGKLRPFVIPLGPYKKLLQRLDQQLKRFRLPSYFYGSRRGRSAVECALVHLHSPHILNST